MVFEPRVGYNGQVFEGKFPPLSDLPKPGTGATCHSQVGDKVIYPNHGLGVVEKVEEKTILGTTCGFFHLRILSNDTTVLVPVANVDNVGLRRAIDDDEVERLFGMLGDGKIDNHRTGRAASRTTPTRCAAARSTTWPTC